MPKTTKPKAERIHFLGAEIRPEFEAKVSKEHTVTVTKQTKYAVTSTTNGGTRHGPWFLGGGGNICVCDTLEEATRVAKALVDTWPDR